MSTKTPENPHAKERPILMSAPMVRALLAGTKTQTRRIAKAPNGAMRCAYVESGWAHQREGGGCTCCELKNPYGEPGDRLWVRETWRAQDGITMHRQHQDEIEYRADGDRPKEPTDSHWRPSIFMPRWASRLTLEITAVRVERLQDISEADAIAEGIEEVNGHAPGMVFSAPVATKRFWRNYTSPAVAEANPRVSYASLWESINGPGSWDANPWVWVIEFRRVER